MTVMLPCIYCKHFHHGRGRYSCKAYPDKIPLEIFFVYVDHRKPHPGDSGIQFEEIPLDMLFKEGYCINCRRVYYEGEEACCEAFPSGIPEKLWNGEILHLEPYPGDNGIRFEEMTEEDSEALRSKYGRSWDYTEEEIEIARKYEPEWDGTI